MPDDEQQDEDERIEGSLWRIKDDPPEPVRQDVNYRRCLGTFVDILGFRAMVEASPTSMEARNRINLILDKFREGLRARPLREEVSVTKRRSFVRNFSDLILRIIPLDDMSQQGYVKLGDSIFETIVHEGIDLCGAQWALSQKGILVRGGITVGDLYWDDDQVFGPALVRAYDLESGLANYPRIVVDSELVQELKQGGDVPWMSWRNWFREDFDGVWFIDYLNFFVSYSRPKIVFDRTGYRKPMERFREFIVGELGQDHRLNHRRAKYLWLAKYFNSVMERAPEDSGLDWGELLISL